MTMIKEGLLQLYYMLGRLKTFIFESFYSLSWYVRYMHTFHLHLAKEFDLINIKPQSLFSWHMGCNYFVGEETKSGRQIFVKTYKWQELSMREAKALEIINAYNSQNISLFPVVVAYDSTASFPFVAFEFIRGQTLKKTLNEKVMLETEYKRKLLKQMILILDLLHKAKIVHRDVRLDNLLLTDSDNGISPKVVLIDFAFAVGVQSQAGHLPELQKVLNDKKILKMLGDGLNPKPFLWDDAYSFCKIAKMIDPHCDFIFPDEWRELYSKVGKMVYRHKLLY